MNKYTGIADYYDLLMVQGYYDYESSIRLPGGTVKT